MEFLGARADSLRIQIFGTDINEKGTRKFSRSGIYPDDAMKNVSADRVAKFFTSVAGGYRVNKAIRDLCIFARQDVSKDPPFQGWIGGGGGGSPAGISSFMFNRSCRRGSSRPCTHALNPSGYLLLGKCWRAQPLTRRCSRR